MEKQEIRTFGRRHGKKLSARKQALIESILPQITPTGNENATILEIGFGGGEHVRLLSAQNPDAIIIGAEPFMNGVAALLGTICDADNKIMPEYENIRIWPDDVRDFLRNNTAKFDEIWVLHPDPWPKARHEKRRLLNTEFIEMLARHLSQSGRIIIGTDHWEYYEWILAQVQNTNLKTSIPDMETIRTRYQQKNKAGTDAPKYLILSN